MVIFCLGCHKACYVLSFRTCVWSLHGDAHESASLTREAQTCPSALALPYIAPTLLCQASSIWKSHVYGAKQNITSQPYQKSKACNIIGCVSWVRSLTQTAESHIHAGHAHGNPRAHKSTESMNVSPLPSLHPSTTYLRFTTAQNFSLQQQGLHDTPAHAQATDMLGACLPRLPQPLSQYVQVQQPPLDLAPPC